MKKITLIVLTFVLCMSIKSNAQTAAETLAIKETILNYLDGYYTGDEARMEKALYHDLAKRFVTPERNGRNGVQDLTAMRLVQITKRKKDDTPEKGVLTAKIKIFEIFDKVAVARSEGDKVNFVDFFHLGKINGEWKIVNIIWAYQTR